VWNAKPFILAEAARIDPFYSKWFFWMDAGQMRDQRYVFTDWPDLNQMSRTFAEPSEVNFPKRPPPFIASSYPHPSAQQNNASRAHKLLFVLISPWPLSLCPLLGILDPIVVRDDNQVSSDLVEGGAFGGSHFAVEWYEQTYYRTMNAWVDDDFFMGKDQRIQNSLLIGYPHSFVALGAFHAHHQNDLCGNKV